MESKNKGDKLEIQLDEETAQGVYVNLAVVNHTEAEFTLDFIYVQPQGHRAKVRSRVITSPTHVRGLLRALQSNLRAYEEKFGANTEGSNRDATVPVPSDGHYH